MPSSSSKPSPPPAFLPRTDPVLAAYFAKLRLWHGFMRFLGLPTLSESSKDVPLDRLFVQPRLSTGPVSPETMDQSDRLPPRLELMSALVDHPRLVVLGDPGSGKSTLINYITDSFARDSITPLKEKLGELVPLPLILRELGVGEDTTWDSLRDAFLARPTGLALGETLEERQKRFDQLLASGQGWVLLDGIDEIGSVRIREQLLSAYEESGRRFPLARFLLTSRVVGYEDMPFDGIHAVVTGSKDGRRTRGRVQTIKVSRTTSGVLLSDEAREALEKQLWEELNSAATRRLYLTPFDNGQVRDFTRKWWMHHRGNPAQAAAEAEEFLAALHLRDDTRILGRVPNLLVLIALVYKVFAKLPDGRSEIYWKIAEAYLENIDRHYKLDLPLPYSFREMAQWLGYVAWHMQLQRHQQAIEADKEAAQSEAMDNPEPRAEILITHEEVLTLLGKVIAQRQGVTAAEAGKLATTFLDYAARRSGLFVPRGADQQKQDRYAFMHLSFQEFFCAVHLQEEIGRNAWWRSNVDRQTDKSATNLLSLRAYAARAEWAEVMVFLFEMIKQGAADRPLELLRALLGEKDIEANDWQPFDAPWPVIPVTSEKRKSRQEAARLPSHHLVELAAMLAMNSEVAMPLPARRNLIHRCWEWEAGRCDDVDQFVSGSNAVARVLSASCFYQDLSLSLLQRLPQIEWFSFSGCTGLTTLEPLTTLTQLLCIDLSDCTGLSTVEPLNVLNRLNTVVLAGCTGLSTVEPLTALTKLESLYLTGCTGLTTVEPLTGLTQLRNLLLTGCTGLTTVEPLTGLTQLRNLLLSGCTWLNTVEPLAGLTQLQNLYLSGCTGLTSVEPLAHLTQLQHLDLRGCTGLPEGAVESLRKQLPNCKIAA